VQGLTLTLDFPSGTTTETLTVTVGVTGSHPLSTGLKYVGDGAFFVEAFGANGQPVTSFNQPFTLTLRYSEASLRGLDAMLLKVYFWDVTARQWVVIPATLDITDNAVIVKLNHLTEFALLASLQHKLYLPLLQR